MVGSFARSRFLWNIGMIHNLQNIIYFRVIRRHLPLELPPEMWWMDSLVLLWAFLSPFCRSLWLFANFLSASFFHHNHSLSWVSLPLFYFWEDDNLPGLDLNADLCLIASWKLEIPTWNLAIIMGSGLVDWWTEKDFIILLRLILKALQNDMS